MSAAPVIAIDGPSASGKGTVAARVAAALGFHYLDSGALYRLTALRALRAGMALQDELGVAALARVLPVRFEAEQVWLEDVEVSVPMRSEEVSQAASKVAALPGVREALMRRQRDFRQTPGLVADGRDMGSVVFPDATLKIFLTASAEIRAERRYKQLISKGVEANISALLDDLRERDARDAARSVAPLRHWPDALLLDTSAMGIEEAVSWVLGAGRKSGCGDFGVVVGFRRPRAVAAQCCSGCGAVRSVRAGRGAEVGQADFGVHQLNFGRRETAV